MEHFIFIEIHSTSSTFRNPEFQNFHKTLNLPPPSTIIGLGGAALGLSPKAAQDFFCENNFLLGITGRSKGKAKDTWKYIKETKSENLRQHQSFSNRSIITKEILYFNRFVIVFGNNDPDLLLKLSSAILNPIFALTLGNSDSLAFVKEINNEMQLQLSESRIIEYCLVKGDVVGETLKKAQLSSTDFAIYQSPESTIVNLPTKFDYENEGYGKRRVIDSSIFSVISSKMELNYSVKGIQYKNVFIPIFEL